MNGFEKEIINKSTVYARQKMQDSHSSHGWDHIERVMNLAHRLTANSAKTLTEEKLISDRFILTTSVILHDIAREDENKSNGKICHAEMGSKMAYEFLIHAGLDENRSSHIRDCILTHRFRKNSKPGSNEAKILFDADKLDSIGAIGIGRAFLFSGEIGANLHNSNINLLETEAYSKEDSAFREFMVKLRHIKDKMNTDRGKSMAENRHKFMEKFFSRMHDEINGDL